MKLYKILGLMSGTSLDGLDLAYCHIYSKSKKWQFKILKTKSVSYDTKMLLELKDAIKRSSEDLLQLHNSYGTWLGHQASVFIQKNELDIDYVASHGHTTHHRPELGFTFQIGSGQHLANAVGHPVICDFRTNDVALGGQGAPLVPIGDRLFFSEYDYCLNLGGISNISFEVKGKRIAYDIGLANMVLNHITRKVDLQFDDNGYMARSGKINFQMLQQLNGLSYYSLPYPKSIGYEWFLKKVVPVVEATQDSIENLLHTCVHHICDTITKQIEINGLHKKSTMLVTGGGALNTFLIETLQNKLGQQVKVVVPEKIIIEFKEALIFALMGVLRIEHQTNVLASVTGARNDSSSGVLYLPN